VLLDTLAAARLRDIPIAIVADGRAVRRPVQLLLHRRRRLVDDHRRLPAHLTLSVAGPGRAVLRFLAALRRDGRGEPRDTDGRATPTSRSLGR
jgi:hypothetical protein